jgi:hypothetical protein
MKRIPAVAGIFFEGKGPAAGIFFVLGGSLRYTPGRAVRFTLHCFN